MGLVNFWKGNLSSYNDITAKNPDVLYFIIDEKKIFLGDIEVSNNDYDSLVELETKKLDIQNTIEW